MLDIKYILENTAAVRTSIKNRNVADKLDQLLAVYSARKEKKLELENTRAAANRIAKEIPKLQNAEKQASISTGRELNKKISTIEEELKVLEDSYQEFMLTIPNQLADDTPLGVDDTENVVVKTHLTPRNFDFQPKDHVELRSGFAYY